MLHRDKTIGKSLYRVVARPGGYAIREIYNDGKSFAMGLSKQFFQTVDAALEELSHISTEQYYTDPSRQVRF